MLKRVAILTILLAAIAACTKEGPYNESADAKADIQHALNEAKAEGLPLVVIFGANWCPDCRAVSAELKTGKNASRIAKEFKIVKVDVGNFDHNLDIAKTYGNPISGGIPGAAFLSTDGALLYVTKPGELSSARKMGDDGIYNFLQKHQQKVNS